MKTSFESVAYRGTFWDYQRVILRRLEDRLDENRLNIVTPPGSGKILIGLEIARRIGDPCLILSSTDISCGHWTSQLVRQFLSDEQQKEQEQFVSSNLNLPSLVTVVTYETLSAAVKKNDSADGNQKISFRDTDIIRLLQESGVRTILLDEPHHLPSHCTDALEGFLGVLGGEIRVVTLTGNPPYDLHRDEWERYVNLCGEVTAEIHVPDLVKSRALCPHQDYVYFNYPTEEESDGIRGYRVRVDEAVAEAMTLPFMGELNHRLSRLYRRRFDYLISHHEAIVALLELLHEYGHSVNLNVYKGLTERKTFEPVALEGVQHAINFLLESQTILRDGEKAQLSQVFDRHRVLMDGRVYLCMTHKMRYTLTASVGKLNSISAITVAEGQSQGDQLRQVILTDSLRSEEEGRFGVDKTPTHVSMVSIFETLRHNCPLMPVGCLTERFAVLPCAAEHALVNKYGMGNGEMAVEPIGFTQYAVFRFKENETLIRGVTDLFRDGYIRVLIGSSESLGHGWDDTFVNTLILAAFRSSVVEADHMRGRVIHADHANANKVAHIWHLVTIENAYSTQQNINLRLASRMTTDFTGNLAVEYRTLRRRFECYIGPNQQTGELENGMDRLGIQSLSEGGGIDAINSDMLAKAASRVPLIQMWQEATVEDTLPIAEVRVPKTAKVPVFTPSNTLLMLMAVGGIALGFSLISFLFWTLLYYAFGTSVLPLVMVALVVLETINVAMILWGILYLLYQSPLLIGHLFAGRSIRVMCRALFKTLKDIGEINKESVMVMEPMPDKKAYRIYLTDCTQDEQMLFQKSVAEMFSSIHAPRYIMVRAGWFRRLMWKWSFACPSVIAKNDISVKMFEKHIRLTMGRMKFQYTRRELGQKYLVFARNRSYLNVRGVVCEKRLHLLKHDPRI